MLCRVYREDTLSEFDIKGRIEKLIACLIKEIDILEIEKNNIYGSIIIILLINNCIKGIYMLL